MKFDEKRFHLRDGRTCILRPTTEEYAEEMIEFLKQMAAETPFLLSYPDEVNYTPEGEREVLRRYFEDEKSAMLCAMVDGVTAGNSSISPVGSQRRVAHRCSLGIALKREYWGLGIGTAMLEYLTELAKRAGYEQIELEVVDGNDRAKKLYEKCGFVTTGKHLDAMKYDDGTCRDEWLMVKML